MKRLTEKDYQEFRKLTPIQIRKLVQDWFNSPPLTEKPPGLSGVKIVQGSCIEARRQRIIEKLRGINA